MPVYKRRHYYYHHHLTLWSTNPSCEDWWSDSKVSKLPLNGTCPCMLWNRLSVKTIFTIFKLIQVPSSSPCCERNQMDRIGVFTSTGVTRYTGIRVTFCNAFKWRKVTLLPCYRVTPVLVNTPNVCYYVCVSRNAVLLNQNMAISILF